MKKIILNDPQKILKLKNKLEKWLNVKISSKNNELLVEGKSED